ncbi:MAG: hypothetical protein Q4C70_13795 [Planctomycetia bacterium]|nr:hypothetical protein [Planctomycetia bacterium]
MKPQTSDLPELSLTPFEQRVESHALGVFLPTSCQKRYEKLHRQKILETRQQHDMDNWYIRCFPR